MKNKGCQKQAVPLFAALLVSCASAPAAPPEWVTLGAEAVYPRGAYIAAEGRSRTAKQAEQDAAAALSLYFSAEVTSVSHSREAWSSVTGYDAQAYSETFVRSAMKLFALRRAAPWYDKGEKTWRALAYIDRAEAWAMFEPRVRKEADEFRALWRVAEGETAALKSYFDYRRVQEHTRRDEFAHTMNFGEVLYPQKMNALTGDIRQNFARLGARLNEARNKAQVFVSANKDYESNITGTLTKLLSGEGLIVTANKKQAAAICAATVDEGFQRNDDGFFYYPKISVIITDTRGVALFSYSASAGKQGAITAEVAKRRAYGELAAALENNFALKF